MSEKVCRHGHLPIDIISLVGLQKAQGKDFSVAGLFLTRRLGGGPCVFATTRRYQKAKDCQQFEGSIHSLAHIPIERLLGLGAIHARSVITVIAGGDLQSKPRVPGWQKCDNLSQNGGFQVREGGFSMTGRGSRTREGGFSMPGKGSRRREGGFSTPGTGSRTRETGAGIHSS